MTNNQLTDEQIAQLLGDACMVIGDRFATVDELSAAKAIGALAVELQERRKADSEPVAEVVSIYGDPEAFGEREIRSLVGIQQMPYGTKLYRHAQPVPVVSTDLLHTAASAIEDLLTTKDRAGAGVWFDLPFRLRSAANAQPAPVVPEEWTIADAVKFCKEAGRQDAGAAMDAWNACRAAMLQASPVCTCPSGNGSLRWPCPVHPGNSPAICIDLASGQDRSVEVRYVAPPGYVMVPKEPTDEMLAAAKEWTGLTSTAEVVYIKMLAAAQQE